MTRRIAVVAALLAAALVAAAPAGAMDFTVSNPASAPAETVATVEHAVSLQANDLDRFWPAAGPANFVASGGLPVTIVSPSYTSANCFAKGATGCHAWMGGTPVGVLVSWDGSAYDFGYVFSHEIMETLVDPAGASPEVCDPFPWDAYGEYGATLATFATPAEFSGGPGQRFFDAGTPLMPVPEQASAPTRRVSGYAFRRHGLHAHRRAAARTSRRTVVAAVLLRR